jgi:hypothetical protein
MLDHDEPANQTVTRRKFTMGAVLTTGAALAGGAWWFRDQIVPNPLRAKCLDRVDVCHKDDLEAIDKSLSPIHEFFANAKHRAPAMVADLTDIGSAIKIVGKSLSDWLSGGNSVEAYVNRFLDAYLEIPKGLERAFLATTQEIEHRWKDNEQELYSGIEADLKSQQNGASIDHVREVMATRTQVELQALARQYGLDAATREAVVGLVLSSVAGAALTRMLLALASRASGTAAAGGAVAAGAAAGPWTMGLSIVAGMLAAGLIEYIAGAYQKKRATEELLAVLDEVHEKSVSEIQLAARDVAGKMRKGRRDGVFEVL